MRFPINSQSSTTMSSPGPIRLDLTEVRIDSGGGLNTEVEAHFAVLKEEVAGVHDDAAQASRMVVPADVAIAHNQSP